MNEFNTRLIKKVQTQSLTSVIYNQLEDMILTGVLKPGERINESQLSAMLQVSRAPIREACRQLEKHGMVSVIADPEDDQLIDIAKGNRQDIVDLVYSVMDGEEPDMGSLSKEMQDYVKTVNVILGKTLYSDSWLEI